MKVRTKVIKMCQHCFTVKKKNKVHVYCKSDPRHKQRQKFGFLPSQVELAPAALNILNRRHLGGTYLFMQAFLNPIQVADNN